MAIPPSSSSALLGFTYDIFISFRGNDTRYGFTGNLWKALTDRGICTFMDDEDLQKGEEITPSLLNAIEQSRTAIIVLSKNYASSSFCLQELSKILDCMKGNGRFVWPVFYYADPFEVRRLRGTYGEALAKHEARSNDNMDTLQKWKNALHQVADLSGFHFKGDKYEHEFIGDIVEEVLRKIRPAATLPVADHLVGVESKKQQVISLLKVGFDDRVFMVGIHGIGGMGKTTLAQAVYNSIAHQFEGSCFLEKVRENSEKYRFPYLAKIFLSQIVGEKKIKLICVTEGIKQRLHQKKVLLILDDVDKSKQLETIIGGPQWFGPGSRVIITTRDEHLLKCLKVERTYKVQEMNNKDALDLLTWKAFKADNVSPSYADILNRAVTYASGLPLALEVIGSHLFNKTIEEWKSALDCYERIPHKQIQTILKVSFNALEEEEKSVFLDIACFFKGYELAMVEKILHAHHGECKKYHISVLVEKSLIKISESGDVTLHDLIEDMGKEIVRQESPKDLGKRSRLWFSGDIAQVLEENMGTRKIETIYLDSEIEVNWDGKAFKKMKNLRTLIIRGGHFSESPKHLPKSLRVLEWRRYPLSGLLSEFHLTKLAICKLDFCDFTSFVWEDLFKKMFENTRVLNLDYCSFLTQIPNISGLLNLEEFSFQHCDNLITIDNSIQLLDKLKILRVKGCSKLRSIPPLKLASLEQLDLSYCDSLINFSRMDELVGELKILRVNGCKKLKNIPPLKLTSLQQLDLSFCVSLNSFPSVVEFLGNLKILSADHCHKLKSFPPLKLDCLEQLDLSNCVSLESFPPMDELLGNLKILRLNGCKKLKSISPLKLASLEQLDLSHCVSLENFTLADGWLGKLEILSFEGCIKLRHISPLNLASLKELDLSNCLRLESFPPVDGLLGKLKILRVKYCSKLRSIPPIKLASLEELYLSNCVSLESFPHVDGLLEKLKILSVNGCIMLRNIPPLKFPSLEQFDLSHCVSLESFPSVDGMLGKLKILRVRGCSKLRSIPSLKLASLKQLDLSYCASLESFPLVDGLLGKLEILSVKGCIKLRHISPLKLASLMQLNLSHCVSLESFPEILGGMENITQLHLDKTPIKELPFSFQNLTHLKKLYLENCGIVQLPSSIIVMSKLVELTIKDGGWLFPRQEEGEEKVSPMQSSQVEFLRLWNCNLSHESLTIGLKWFTNVKELYLSRSKFTILPDCIKNCHSLWKLVLDNCWELKEITGIPPSLKTLSAFNCISLTSLCKSELLNQELLESGNTNFLLPLAEIPEWFDHQCMQQLSISFWFRNKFPAIALCVIPPLTWNDSLSNVRVIINDNTFFYRAGGNKYKQSEMDHLHLFHMQIEKFNDNPNKTLFKNKWNHVKVDFGFPFQKSGIHVLKEKSSMKDIRFTNPSL